MAGIDGRGVYTRAKENYLHPGSINILEDGAKG